MYSLSRISKVRPKRVSSSSCHCSSIDGGQADDDLAHLLAQEQLAGDQPGFDGLAQADVVGDEEVDAGQQQRLAQAVQAGRHRAGCQRGTATGTSAGRSP